MHWTNFAQYFFWQDFPSNNAEWPSMSSCWPINRSVKCKENMQMPKSNINHILRRPSHTLPYHTACTLSGVQKARVVYSRESGIKWYCESNSNIHSPALRVWVWLIMSGSLNWMSFHFYTHTHTPPTCYNTNTINRHLLTINTRKHHTALDTHTGLCIRCF